MTLEGKKWEKEGEEQGKSAGEGGEKGKKHCSTVYSSNSKPRQHDRTQKSGTPGFPPIHQPYFRCLFITQLLLLRH